LAQVQNFRKSKSKGVFLELQIGISRLNIFVPVFIFQTCQVKSFTEIYKIHISFRYNSEQERQKIGPLYINILVSCKPRPLVEFTLCHDLTRLSLNELTITHSGNSIFLDKTVVIIPGYCNQAFLVHVNMQSAEQIIEQGSARYVRLAESRIKDNEGGGGGVCGMLQSEIHAGCW
jgi:hypothetical protein